VVNGRVADVHCAAVDTTKTGKRVSLVVHDRYVVDTEPDVSIALPLDVARKLRDQLVDAVDQLQGTRWFR
jgi:hypothetical protein